MRFYATPAATVSVLFLLGAAGAAAQQGTNPAEIQPEAQEIMVELQAIQAELEPIQQEALGDPEIQAEQQQLGEQIQVAMAELDPQTPERMARLEELVGEAQTAQAEQDAEAVGAIMTEAQEIQQRLQETQARAIERPEIAPQVEAFQARLQTKMIEIDPEAESLITRAQELDERLAEFIGGGG